MKKIYAFVKSYVWLFFGISVKNVKNAQDRGLIFRENIFGDMINHIGDAWSVWMDKFGNWYFCKELYYEELHNAPVDKMNYFVVIDKKSGTYNHLTTKWTKEEIIETFNGKYDFVKQTKSYEESRDFCNSKNWKPET